MSLDSTTLESGLRKRYARHDVEVMVCDLAVVSTNVDKLILFKDINSGIVLDEFTVGVSHAIMMMKPDGAVNIILGKIDTTCILYLLRKLGVASDLRIEL